MREPIFTFTQIGENFPENMDKIGLSKIGSCFSVSVFYPATCEIPILRLIFIVVIDTNAFRRKKPVPH